MLCYAVHASATSTRRDNPSKGWNTPVLCQLSGSPVVGRDEKELSLPHDTQHAVRGAAPTLRASHFLPLLLTRQSMTTEPGRWAFPCVP